MRLRNNKGITLIALVITIIVLLILAGVALNAIAGENGILNKAKQAKEQTDAARNKEEMQLGLGGAYINKWTSKNGEEEYNDFLQDLLEENVTIKGLIKNEYNWQIDEEIDYLIVEQNNQLYTTTYNYNQDNVIEQMLNNMELVDASILKADYEVFYDIWFNNREYIWDGISLDSDDENIYMRLVKYDSQDYLYKEEYNDEITTYTYTLESITISKPDNIVSISNGLNAVYGIDTEGNVWDLRVIPQNINEKYNLQDVTFTKISAGDSGVLMLDSTGKMWGYGRNSYGQLGSTELDSELTQPVCISNIETNPLYGIVITDISLATYHWDGCGLALDNTGKVYYFGYGVRDYFGTYGELDPICINTMENSPLNDVTITKISSGSPWNALFLDSDGKVWTFLSGGSWMNGTNNADDNGFPICINDVEGNPLEGVIITDISAGYRNSLVVDSEGKIWSWGEYYGDDTEDSVNIPTCLSNITTNPLYGIKAQKISAGAWHTLILDTQGKVWGYGDNYRGELLLEDESIELPVCLSDYENSELYNKTITDISAGYDCTGLIDSENNYYLYGNFKVQFEA